MALEQVTLTSRTHVTVPGEAEVERRTEGARMMRAGGVAAGCIVGGALSIFIPGAHFVLPWALPLGGIGVAIYLYSVTGVLSEARGACPMCHKQMKTDGGNLEDPMWVRCGACQAPLRIGFNPEPEAPTAPSGAQVTAATWLDDEP